MKKSSSVVILVAFALSLFAASQTTNAGVFFRDDFQSDAATLSGGAGDFDPVIGAGDVGGEWSLMEYNSETFIQVVNDDSPWSGTAGANNYVAIERQSGHEDARLRAQGWDAEVVRNQILTAKCSIYVPSGIPSACAVTGWDDSGWEEPWWEGRAFDVYFNTDGYVWFYDGVNWPMIAGNKLFSYTQGVWQDVTITADMSAGTFSLSVDGNTANDLTWAGGVSTIQSLTFMSDSNNTKFCIDNVELTVVPEPSALAGLIGIFAIAAVGLYKRM